jgi:hypothetical protein
MRVMPTDYSSEWIPFPVENVNFGSTTYVDVIVQPKELKEIPITVEWSPGGKNPSPKIVLQFLVQAKQSSFVQIAYTSRLWMEIE